MSTLYLKFLGLVMTLLFATMLAAQDTLSAIDLEPVTITSTRTTQPLWKAGRSVKILQKSEWLSLPAFTIGGLLATLPGAHITGINQNPGQLQALFLRGTNANHTNVLIDGIKISDPTAVDNALDLSELSLINLERVEVVGGAHSTLYGSSALGGVVNLITQKKQTPGWHLRAGLQEGTFGPKTNQLSEMLALNYTHYSGWYVNTEVFHTKVHGLDATLDTVTNTTDYESLHRDRDHFNKLDLNAKVGLQRGPWDIFLSATGYNHHADIDDGAYRDDNNYTVEVRRQAYAYGATYAFNPAIRLSITGGLTRFHRHLLDDSTVVAANGDTDHSHWESNNLGWAQHHEATLNHESKFGSVVLGSGLTIDQMTIRSTYFSSAFGPFILENNLDKLNIHMLNAYQFAHVELQHPRSSNRPFKLGLGLRHQHHELYGSHLTYAINPSWQLHEHLLTFVSWSTGFNAPSLYQLYAPERDFTSGVTRGNVTLKPETGTSIEWGIKVHKEHWDAQLSVYHNQIKQLIDFVYLWDMSTPPDHLSYLDFRGDTYLNLGRQKNLGMELSLNYKPHPQWQVQGWVHVVQGSLHYQPEHLAGAFQAYHLQLYNNGSFLNSAVKQQALSRRPSSAFIQVNWKPTHAWTVYGGVRHVAQGRDIFYDALAGPFGALGLQTLKSYSLIHAGIGFKPTDRWRINLRTENLTNAKYTDVIGYAVKGRSINLGVIFEF